MLWVWVLHFLSTPTESTSVAELSMLFFPPVDCELLEDRFLFDYVKGGRRERRKKAMKELGRKGGKEEN